MITKRLFVTVLLAFYSLQDCPSLPVPQLQSALSLFTCCHCIPTLEFCWTDKFIASNTIMLTAYRAALPATMLLSSIVAFALAICCLLAGTNPATLQNMQLFTLNTSGIGTHIQRQMGLPPPDSSFNISGVLLPRGLPEELDSSNELLFARSDKLLSDAAQVLKDPKTIVDDLKTNITETVDDGKKKLTSAAKAAKDKAKNATAKVVST